MFQHRHNGDAGLERGSEANQPLALAVVGGLSSSTLLSLFLVPTMYLLLAQPPTEEEKRSRELEASHETHPSEPEHGERGERGDPLPGAV